jgi:hypothetical protein
LLVGTALRNADLVFSTGETFSKHLDAKQKVISFYSSSMAQEQWKVESKKWFQSDLARLQWEVLSMAQGYGHDLPYATDWSAQLGFNACQNVKFVSQGWKNVDLFGLVGLLMVALLLWISTMMVQDTVVLVWLVRDMIIPAFLSFAVYITAVAVFTVWVLWPLLKARLQRLAGRAPGWRRQ